MAEDEIRERARIEGDLGEWLCQKIWDSFGTLRLGGSNFRPLDSEECEELGNDDDDPAVLLRRESDGQVFEVDIDVTARKVSAPAKTAEGGSGD